MKKLIYGMVLLSLFLFSCSSIPQIEGTKGLDRSADRLKNSLDQLINNFAQYEIVLFSIDNGQEHLKIQDVYRGEADIVIKFKYRGETRLTLTRFEENNAKAYGTYQITLPFPVGTSNVNVELIFNSDGSAQGKWKNLGFKHQFNIVRL